MNAAEIEAARTPAGGWTKAQLTEWGVAWPPARGWKAALLAQVDTHPKGGDALAAPFMGSAVGQGPMRPETPAKSLKTVPQLGGQG